MIKTVDGSRYDTDRARCVRVVPVPGKSVLDPEYMDFCIYRRKMDGRLFIVFYAGWKSRCRDDSYGRSTPRQVLIVPDYETRRKLGRAVDERREITFGDMMKEFRWDIER